MERIKLSENCYFTKINEKKFISNRISVHIITPITEENATSNALIAQMIRQGNEVYPTFADLTNRLYSLYGASLGSDIDKIGDRQILSIFVQGIDDRFSMENEPLLQEFAQLLLDILLKPKLEDGGVHPQKLKVEKENLRQNIEAEINDKRRYALKRARDTVYKGTNYNLSKFGDIAKIGDVTPVSIIDNYFSLLKEAHIEIVAVGPGEFEKVIPSFQDVFSKMEKKDTDVLQMEKFSFNGGYTELVEEMDINQAKLVLLFLKDKKDDSLNSNVYRMANTVFGGAPFSKLFVNVREKQSLCYYCDSSYDRITGLLSVDLGIDPKDHKKATDTIVGQLQKMQNGDITNEEIEQSKLLLINAFTALKDRLSSLENIYMSNLLTGKSETIDEQIAQVKQVTKEDIVKAFSGFSLKTNYLLQPKGGVQVEEN